MLLEVKVFFVGLLYLLGGLFMVIFPPKNFKLTGSSNPQLHKLVACKFTNGTDANSPSAKLAGCKFTASDFKNYLTSKEINNFIQELVNREPDFVTVVPLTPNTRMNNTIRVVEIKTDQGVKKKGVLVIGALDPMAWAAAMSVLELAMNMLTDPQFRTPYLTDYDWYLIPAGNPDGMDYTLSARDLPVSSLAVWCLNMTGARSRPALWHKNLAGQSEGCFGTNIDRNFAYHWQDDATNSSPQRPCSQRYHGQKPFSTVEACVLRQYVDRLAGVLDIAIHLSAVYQQGKESIVYPWRYASRRPYNWLELQGVGEAAARLAGKGGHRAPHYEVYQSSADGAFGGSLEDYLKGVVGAAFVYAVRPYHQPIPNTTSLLLNKDYIQQATAITLGLVRAHRNINKRNTLSYFGTEKQF